MSGIRLIIVLYGTLFSVALNCILCLPWTLSSSSVGFDASYLSGILLIIISVQIPHHFRGEGLVCVICLVLYHLLFL